jgi:hypothetical protein
VGLQRLLLSHIDLVVYEGGKGVTTITGKGGVQGEGG